MGEAAGAGVEVAGSDLARAGEVFRSGPVRVGQRWGVVVQVAAVLYFALFVAMAVIAAAAFGLWSAREARRWAERRARMAEPVLTERAPVRPPVRNRPP